jgi:GNAT superfamily N-acetyltransferase
MQEAFQDHWGYVPGTEENYQEWLNGRLFQPALWQIAWAGEEVIGTVLAFIDEAQNRKYNRRRGYTEEITVRRPWRKHGVARALIARSLQQLKALGMTEAALGVDTENLSGALRLYESMGFRPVQRGSIYAKPL